jgi:Zn-dependent protease/CBS domain-containing protein
MSNTAADVIGPPPSRRTKKGFQTMKWSLWVGRISGIDVYLHVTFVLLVTFLGFVFYQAGGGRAAVDGVVFLLSVFGCILLHELGHALAAREFKIKTRDITLYPIGGVARLERMPDKPLQELWVALAGPAVNVVIAAALFGILALQGGFQPLGEVGWARGPFLERLLLVNIFLVLFNMLPAFPMDGGRVVRALLATRLEYGRATQIAAGLGQFMAVLFGLWGMLSGNFMLLFIALFVWIGAAQEAGAAQMKTAVGGLPVSSAMITEFQVLHPHDTLRRACDLIIAGSQHDFPVVWNGETLGILTRKDLITGLAQKGEAASVSDVMNREFQTADAGEMLDSVLARLDGAEVSTMPVTRNGQLVGLLTVENIGELVMIQSALKARRQMTPGS